MKIHSSYPGGNIKVVKIEENTVYLEQDIRDTGEWWFYWNFCIEGAAGKTLHFSFVNGEVIGCQGPAVSHDGIGWRFLGKEYFESHTAFTYAFGSGENKMYFAFAIPYQLSHFRQFTEKHTLTSETLTVSEGGRPVPLLVLGNRDVKNHILLTGRHHACESSAAYVIEGFITALLQKGQNILNRYCFHIIPFIDIDGVENGDQGKSRMPHDHNRDYGENPIYASVRAVKEYVKNKNIVAAVDFHSPYKWCGENDYCFFVKPPSPGKEMTEELGELLAEITMNRKDAGKLNYCPEQAMESGLNWNQTDTPTFSNHLRSQGAALSFTFEITYFGGEEGGLFSVDSGRSFGEDFYGALTEYLNKK